MYLLTYLLTTVCPYVYLSVCSTAPTSVRRLPVCLPVYLPAYLSVCLFYCLYVRCLSVCLSVCLFYCPYIRPTSARSSIGLSVLLSLHPSARMSFCLSVLLSLHPSDVCGMSARMSARMSICLSVLLSLHLSDVCPYVYRSVCSTDPTSVRRLPICLSVCLSHNLLHNTSFPVVLPWRYDSLFIRQTVCHDGMILNLLDGLPWRYDPPSVTRFAMTVWSSIRQTVFRDGMLLHPSEVKTSSFVKFIRPSSFHPLCVRSTVWPKQKSVCKKTTC